MMRWLVALFAVAACGDPPPMVLKFRVTDGAVQSCTSSTGTKAMSCDQVTMLCDAYASIRIFSPTDSTAPFVSACQPLAVGSTTKNLCSIAQVDLPAPATPVSAQTLEVDIAIYVKDSLHKDDSGNPICPPTTFGADGFPVPAVQPCTDPDPSTCEPQPAVGGRAFYHPGDTETLVSLGCTNLSALEDRSCAGQNALAVSATVNDFDTSVSVSPTTADSLLVSVGEPIFFGGTNGYQLPPADAHALARANQAPVPSWTGNFDNLMLTNAACLDVFEDGALTPAALTCTSSIARNPLDLPGVRLSSQTLGRILAARGIAFPDAGLVVGRTLDYTGAPKPGVSIVPSNPASHILYLSDDLTTVVPGPTSKSGVWISQDAPFGTTFTTTNISVLTQPGFGGLVQKKVDIVILQFKNPGTGG